MKLTILLIFILVFQSKAPAASNLQFKGTDITALVNHLESKVQTLNQSISIYNWSNNNGEPLDKITNSILNGTRSFWYAYGQKKANSNLYGLGLYGAVDPVSTVGFGGGNGWTLAEMLLPVGFKFIDIYDINEKTPFSFNQEDLNILNKFQCPGQIDDLFREGGDSLPQSCQDLVKKIFRDTFKIDGFAYSYSRTNFKECKYNYNGFKAFVITDQKWLKNGKINIYTESTTDKKEERIRIQTLFLKAYVDQLAIDKEKTKPISDYLNSHSDSNLKGSTVTCSADTCTISVRFCDSKNSCDSIDLKPLPRPGGPLITLNEALRNDQYPKLLWADLEGESKSTTVSQWLKTNMYQCDVNRRPTP